MLFTTYSTFKVSGEVQGEAISLSDVADNSRIEWYKNQGLEITAVQSTQPLSEVHPDAHATISRPQVLPASSQNSFPESTGLDAPPQGYSSQANSPSGVNGQALPAADTQTRNTAGEQNKIEGIAPAPPSGSLLEGGAEGAVNQAPLSNRGNLATRENRNAAMTDKDRNGPPVLPAQQAQQLNGIQHQSSLQSGTATVPGSSTVSAGVSQVAPTSTTNGARQIASGNAKTSQP